MRVCLLERGKAYPPGSFPRSPWGTSRNLWDPSEGLHGLLNVWEFRGLGGIVASGLGGGSLLYSNVLIRKDRVDLRARGPRRTAAGSTGRSRTRTSSRTTHATRRCSARSRIRSSIRRTAAPTRRMRSARPRSALGLEWYLPKLAVTFAPDGGAARAGCADRRRGGEPARAAPPDVPPLRRVQLRVQLRRRRTRSTSTTSRSRSFATASTSERAARRRPSLLGRAVATPSATSITAKRSRASRAAHRSPSGRSLPTGSSSAPEPSARPSSS